MPTDKWGDDKLKLHPDNKYKGILYSTKPFDDEDEVPLMDQKPQRKRRASSGGTRRSGGWSSARPPRGGVSQDTAKMPRLKASKSFTQKSSGGGRRNYTPPSVAVHNFFKDHFVRTTVTICVVIAVASSIAIPTAFARPTTNISLNDGGRVMNAPTAARTVQEFLDDNKVTLGPDDFLETDADAPITEGMEIIIRRAMPVTVDSEEASITVNMVAGTVQDALDRANVVPALQDEVYPSLDTYVRAGMHVEHITVETETTTEQYDIPYETEEREDSSLSKGDTEVAQYGEEGTLEITHEKVYKNGVMTSDVISSEDVIKNPITEIISVGTYVPPPPKKTAKKISEIHSGGSSGGGGGGGNTDSGGGGGKGTVTVRVTAYCSACNTGNRTATGGYPSWGTVAANTSQFPFGTKLYIPGYGDGRVEDTGGFGPGTIDVYLGERDVCRCGSEWPTGTYTITVY